MIPSVLKPFIPVFAAVLLSACNEGDTVLTTPETPDTPTTVFSAVLTVRDARTHLPLEGAEASVSGGRKGVSGSDGVIRLDSLEEGGSLIKVAHAGYAALMETVEIEGDGSKSAVKAVTRIVDLHKTGVTLKGRLYLRPVDGKTDVEPVADGKLELRMDGAFENPYRTVKTSASGEYSFSDLPEQAGYTLYPGQLIREGVLYSADPVHSDGNGTVAGGQVAAGQLILEAAMDANPILLSPMTLDVRPEDSVILRFSEPIDTVLLVPGSIVATQDISDDFFTGMAFAVDTRWSADAKSLVVRPFQGQWPENDPVSIRLTGFRGLSGVPLLGPAGGAVLSIALNATAGDGALEAVDSLWVAPRFSFNSNSMVETADLDNIAQLYTLAWTKAAGATQYEVYSRENPELPWSLIQVATGTEFTYNSSAPNGYTTLRRQHMVVPRNWSRRGRFSDAMVLTLKDKVRPVIGGVGLNQWQSFYSSLSKLGVESLDNTFGTSDKVIDLFLTLRGPQGSQLEPLDTTRTPAVRYLRPEGEVEGVVHEEFRWISPTTARLKIRIEPGVSAQGINPEINFQIIQDMAGNPVAYVNGMTTATFYLSN